MTTRAGACLTECRHAKVHAVELVHTLEWTRPFAALPVKTRVDLCELCRAMRAVVFVGTRMLESPWEPI